MESEGELFNAQLERQPHPVVLDALARLAAARQRLDERLAEKLADA